MLGMDMIWIYPTVKNLAEVYYRPKIWRSSVPSLIAGLAFGVILAAGGSGLLAVVMGYRFYNTYKIMPAGMVCALSLMMLIRSLYKMNT
uniref:Uncharacterized protein n=1 Tax=Romanomermis culicivorax TaxID=13658 RepID=A0A915JHD1_ROMCU